MTPVRGPKWRLRAIRRKMSWEHLERTIPNRPGWKREYYDVYARVRPSWARVEFDMTLARRPVKRAWSLRAVRLTDADALRDAFFDAFRFAPEYACYPMAKYRRRTMEYVEGFYGEVRGTRSDCSRIIVRGGRILAACLIKERSDQPPLLDCIFVRPEQFRSGFATAVTVAATTALHDAGAATLQSSAMWPTNRVSLGTSSSGSSNARPTGSPKPGGSRRATNYSAFGTLDD